MPRVPTSMPRVPTTVPAQWHHASTGPLAPDPEADRWEDHSMPRVPTTVTTVAPPSPIVRPTESGHYACGGVLHRPLSGPTSPHGRS
jgi:hypothetical protein